MSIGTVVIMAGGTGGHIFPGIAAANEFRRRGYSVQWLGTEQGLEATLVPENNIPLNKISVNGIRGKGFAHKVKAPFMLLRSIVQAWRLLKKLKPSIVVGFGGFVAGPGGLAAWLQQLPLVIHEQNAVAGTTNSLLAKFATKVATAFPNVIPDAIHIGNPVRLEIEQLETPEQRQLGAGKKLNLLILGGSRGARFINQTLPKVISAILLNNRVEDFTVVHQTGSADADNTAEEYQNAKVTAEVLPFITDMAQTLAKADLVVCRAGALTVSELAAAGVGSVLIPFPFAIDDHQTANAAYLAEGGAGIVMQQSDTDDHEFATLLGTLLSDRKRLTGMANSARSLAMPQAAKKFVDICEEAIRA